MRQVEVGYTFLARKCWGLGFNHEMKGLMLNHAFQHVDRVVFFIGEGNLRSQKAILNIGARLVDRLERNPSQGVPYTALIYAINRTEFKASSLLPVYSCHRAP